MKFLFSNRVLCGMILLLGLSCDENEPAQGNDSTLTCFDGILNGNEVTVDCGGDCPGFCPLSSIGILEGELVSTLQLDPDVEYTLTGPYLIRDKASLSIPAGTVIKADPGAYIAVAQGGIFFVFGQPENPVVITSNAENPAPGDWGGIVICGKAPILPGEVGRTDIVDIFYGGTETEDSSGGINYLRIEYAGGLGENQQNFDGIAFYGVGAFTPITHLQTYESLGNGIRFIGGNANAERLVATKSGFNSIVVQDDWSGNGDSWYLSGISQSGLKITNDAHNSPVVPTERDTIGNISVLGPTTAGGLHYSATEGKYTLSNVFTTQLDVGIQVDGTMASAQVDMGNLQINSIQFNNPLPNFIPTNYSGSNLDFYQEDNTTGAGNGASPPDWTNGWTRGLE